MTRAPRAQAAFSCIARQSWIAVFPAAKPRSGFEQMAAHPNQEPELGHSDMAEHLRTWRGFMTFMKWQAIGAAALLALLAIFRTHD